MSPVIQIRVSSSLYVRDPEETLLGRKIVGEAVKLIDSLGFNDFTFKKLAAEIQSTEASVYRYFKSKQQLLQYLFAWYWSWLEYRLMLCTLNIQDPAQKLGEALRTLTESISSDPSFPHLDESILHRVVISESKPQDAYTQRTKMRDGPAESFESLCAKVAEILRELNPKYKTPKALALTLISATHEQRYLAQYLPGITEIKPGRAGSANLLAFLESLVSCVREG